MTLVNLGAAIVFWLGVLQHPCVLAWGANVLYGYLLHDNVGLYGATIVFFPRCGSWDTFLLPF